LTNDNSLINKGIIYETSMKPVLAKPVPYEASKCESFSFVLPLPSFR